MPAIGLPLAVVTGWSIDCGAGCRHWQFVPAGSPVTGRQLADAMPYFRVRRAVSVRVLAWGFAFRYGRPYPVVAANAAGFVAAVQAGLTGRPSTQEDAEFVRKLKRLSAERN